MKRRLFLLLLIGLIGGHSALAQSSEEPLALPDGFIAVYRLERSLRAEPRANSELIVKVPEDSRLFLTPVSLEYAATSYEGQAGYIFYGDAVADDAAMENITPYYAITVRAEHLYDAPHYSANIKDIFSPESCLWVQGHIGGFAAVNLGDETGYVPLKSLVPLKADTAIAAKEAYMNEADVLLLNPVSGAAALCVVPMGAKVTQHATNGIYAAILYEDQAGYVERAKLIESRRESREVSIAFVNTPAVMYTAPNKHAYSEDFLPRGILVCVDSVSGAYSHIASFNAYVPTANLVRVNQAPLTPFYGYWEEDQPLYTRLMDKPIKLDITLKRHMPLEISINAPGGYYLVQVDGQWGYIQKEGMKVLKEKKLANTQATIARAGTEVKQFPFSDGTTLFALENDTPLWLTHTLEGYAAIQSDDVQGYVAVDELTVIGENKEVRTYEAYIANDTALYDFPGEAVGSVLGSIKGNTLVKISITNGDYGYISYENTKGYAPLESAVALSSLFSRADGRYYVIYLNKEKYELSVYEADMNFKRKGEPLRTAVIAIGKRTTPTPSGEFDLGGRERWHYFGPSFAPFAIEYAPGKYLHGPLYYSSNERALNTGRLKDFGTMATGGCLRMPYEDILWIYCHCNEKNTKLVIVNGEAAE